MNYGEKRFIAGLFAAQRLNRRRYGKQLDKVVKMSRSRKRNRVTKQANDKFFKRYSNKMIRHRDIASGGAFRKVMDGWNIFDFRTYGKGDLRK